MSLLTCTAKLVKGPSGPIPKEDDMGSLMASRHGIEWKSLTAPEIKFSFEFTDATHLQTAKNNLKMQISNKGSPGALVLDFPDADSRNAVIHMYKFGSLDTFNAHVLATDADDATIKKLALEKNRKLNDLFNTLVLTGKILSPQEFWAAHRESLVAAILSQPKIGLPNLDDDILGDSENVDAVVMPASRIQQIFIKEPKVKQAFDKFVSGPTPKMDDKQFWTKYVNALRDRRKLEKTDGVPRIGLDMDVLIMEPVEFFEAYRRGELDPTGSLHKLMESKTQRRTKHALGTVDPEFDLMATIEGQSREHRDVESRAGYGTSSHTKAYFPDERDIPLDFLTNEEVRESMQRTKRATDLFIQKINRHSNSVIEFMAPSARVNDGTLDAEEPASAANELVDLQQTSSREENLAQLEVDFGAMKDAMRAQGDNTSTDGMATASGVKRQRSVDTDSLLDLLPSELDFLKVTGKACKKVASSMMLAAHDNFGRKPRFANGFSADIPSEWQQYIIVKLANHQEILRQFWSTLRAEDAFMGRRTALLAKISSEYDEIQSLKDRVNRADPFQVHPFQPASAGVAIKAAEGTAVEARTEVVSLLNSLQEPLSRAVAANTTYRP